MTSVHALLARAKLRNTHRRMRNDGNVSREKCTAPRASNRPSILVQRDVRRGVALSLGSSVIASRRDVCDSTGLGYRRFIQNGKL